MSRPIVLYDADCGVCLWSMARVLAWDRRRRLRPLALQAPEADALLGGMDHERKMASWHLVSAGGNVQSAGRALVSLLRMLPGGRPLAAALERVPGGPDRLYFAVAERRSLLGRLVPGGARARARARVEERERALAGEETRQADG